MSGGAGGFLVPDDVVRRRRVVLHIGAPKSGTTYVQSRLTRNAANLAQHGVLVPQGAPDDRPAALVFRAALDLTDVRMNRGREFSEGYWPRLVERVSAHEGTVVLSHEAFVRADDAAVERAVADLAADGAELHVVYTARELGRLLVSAWLEGLKNGGRRSLAEHLGRARDGDLAVLRGFDIPAVLGRWRAHLPADRVHVVTVPPATATDPDLLWHRFLEVARLQRAWLPEPATRANASVGVPEAQVLLALNSALDGESRRGRRHHAVVRRIVVGDALAGRTSPRVELDPAHVDWVRDRARGYADWVREQRLDVVGDLADLDVVAPDPESWVDPGVPHAGVAPAAASALAALLRSR
ncbi:hypothetical protein [Nocardioides sp. R-C-SC26]|uniref:hypothetical protein n=1 Tax=Nocardioides sp. R-C-SC26 TaxID=2870414 RepID=UPI001E3E65FB|nr:hypothetical protein [Nocardioides sp. R-C-SC26]